MRKIKANEVNTILFLKEVSGANFEVSIDEMVWVVNEDMGSIRSINCPLNRKVKYCSRCEFIDRDDVTVIVTLLLTEDGGFGELDFWKVNDDKILCHPENSKSFVNAKI